MNRDYLTRLDKFVMFARDLLGGIVLLATLVGALVVWELLAG
jgi:hypothetical protein